MHEHRGLRGVAGKPAGRIGNRPTQAPFIGLTHALAIINSTLTVFGSNRRVLYQLQMGCMPRNNEQSTVSSRGYRSFQTMCVILSYLTIIYSRKHFSLHSDLHDLHFMLFSIYHDTAFTTRYINRLFSASLRFFYHIIHKWAKMPSHFHHLYSFLH